MELAVYLTYKQDWKLEQEIQQLQRHTKRIRRLC